LCNHPLTPPSLPPYRGGYDVLSIYENCVVYDKRCEKQIAEAISILADLLRKMHWHGIQHVIFMG